jgi:hypothetical protein
VIPASLPSLGFTWSVRSVALNFCALCIASSNINIGQDQTSRSEHDQPSISEGNNMSDIGRSLKGG